MISANVYRMNYFFPILMLPRFPTPPNDIANKNN